jgi:hypothetical protein
MMTRFKVISSLLYSDAEYISSAKFIVVCMIDQSELLFLIKYLNVLLEKHRCKNTNICKNYRPN